MAEAVNQRTNAQARVVLSPEEGETVWLRKLGVRFMIGGEDTHDNFALVEHPIGPRALAAPMHTHRYKDEYTYVLEGEVGVQVGEEVLVAHPGDLVFKPRGYRTPSGIRPTSRRGRWRSSLRRASSGISPSWRRCSRPPTKARWTRERSAP
jgi:quercetin dioxygenase-like cupin family protein